MRGFKKADAVLAREVGEVGTPERAEFDAKARAWYYGEVLRERRKELGLTQKDLAELVNRERTYINRIEKGETDLQLSSFIRIAEALGIVLRLDVNLA
jgi:ribosome-binding protein aMBF1 (putative translation factor)